MWFRRGRHARVATNFRLATILLLASGLVPGKASDAADADLPIFSLDDLRAVHPRLVFHDDVINTLVTHLSMAAEDDPVQRWLPQVVDYSETRIHAREPYSCPDPSNGIKPIWGVRCALNRIYMLVMLHRLAFASDDQESANRHAERAWEELRALMNDDRWGDFDFLILAEAANAVGIGYDSLHPWLSQHADGPARLAALRDYLADRVLALAHAKYTNGRDLPRWKNNQSNQNKVINGGFLLAALALGDDDPNHGEIAEAVVNAALEHITLDWLQPDGGWPEGPTYWNYALRYLTLALEGLDRAVVSTEYRQSLRDRFGHGGLTRTARYAAHIMGQYDPPGAEDGQFTIGDADRKLKGAPAVFWLAERYGCAFCVRQELARTDAVLAAWQRGELDANEQDLLMEFLPLFPLHVLWWPRVSGFATSPHVDPLPTTARLTGGPMSVYALRDRWNVPDGGFLGVILGSNDHGHAQLDLGAFVLDLMGVRWAEELGKDGVYDQPCFFRTTLSDNCTDPESGDPVWRYSYFHNRAEGHNTLVIRPAGAAGQQEALAEQDLQASSSTVLEPREGDSLALLVADLTKVYATGALGGAGLQSVQRGFAYDRVRGRLLIRDEIRAETPIDIWWLLYTRARVSLLDDGHVARLSLDHPTSGRRLRLDLTLTMKNEPLARFTVAEVLPGDAAFRLAPVANAERREPLVGYQRLAVALSGVTTTDVTVTFHPADEKDKWIIHSPPLSEWRYDDFDGDNLPDTWELFHGLEPLDAADAGIDADGDGLDNQQEYQVGSHPQLADSDADGLSDGYEIDNGLDPRDGAGCPDWLCGGGRGGWRVILPPSRAGD